MSPNYTKMTNKVNKEIIIHHMAGNLSVEACGAGFADPKREASSNYGIGTDGRIGLYVDEINRSWCSSSREHDSKAITIEVANDQIGGNWHVSDKALASLINLCVDICQRNKIEKLNFTGDASGNLLMHCYFIATECPGPYLKGKFKYIADEVNKRLGNTNSQFKMRTTKPEAGNKYYITKANGGWSDAIKGSPTDTDCNVLSNCVGYAYGRFNEIGNYGYCKYLRPVNAENFIQYKGDLEVGQTPKLGACMVWKKGNTLSNSDGAGHVAIVEKVVNNTEVYTSESGWGCKPFWNQTRQKGDGNWGQNSAYTFLGFIYNPAVEDVPVSDAKPSEPNLHYIVHVVKSRETLSGIASQYNTTYQALAKYNNIANPNHIKVGQKIKIPVNGPSYTIGKTYKTQVDCLSVRTGAGTNYERKTYAQLSSNARKNATKDGYLKKDVAVTCLEIKCVGSDIWMRIPSGWCAAYYNGEYYIK
jgi:LysM repeat protein